MGFQSLPCPLPYEEIAREAFRSKVETFEGFRFDFTKPFQKFSLSHSLLMGPTKIPSQFGAIYLDTKYMLVGEILSDGRINARIKADLSDELVLKATVQMANASNLPIRVFNFDYAGSNYRGQLQFGNRDLIGATYIQSVTPHLSLGGEVFWAGVPQKSKLGIAARYNNDKMVASAKVGSTGVVLLNYVQKISEKVSLAADFVYNSFSRDVTASVAYDYILGQSRVRGKIDSNGVTSALVEEKLSSGLGLLLSAELDHKKHDFKFGFGLTAGS